MKKIYSLFLILVVGIGLMPFLITAANPPAMQQPKRFYLDYKPSGTEKGKYFFLLKQVGNQPLYGASYQLDSNPAVEPIKEGAQLLEKNISDTDNSLIYAIEYAYNPTKAPANKYFWVSGDKLLQALQKADNTGQGGIIDVSDVEGISASTEKIKEIKLQDSLVNRLRANPKFIQTYIGASYQEKPLLIPSQKKLRFYLFYKSAGNDNSKKEFLLKKVGNESMYGASYQLDPNPEKQKIMEGSTLLRSINDQDPDDLYVHEFTPEAQQLVPTNAPAPKYFWVPAERILIGLQKAGGSGEGATVEVPSQGGVGSEFISMQPYFINKLRSNPDFVNKFIGKYVPENIKELKKTELVDLPKDVLFVMLQNAIDWKAKTVAKALLPASGFFLASRYALSLKNEFLRVPSVAALKRKLDLEQALQKYVDRLVPKEEQDKWGARKSDVEVHGNDFYPQLAWALQIKEGETDAIHFIAYRNDIKILNTLLPKIKEIKEKDNIDYLNSQDRSGSVPLFSALYRFYGTPGINDPGKNDILKVLLDNGANPNMANNANDYPLTIAIQSFIFNGYIDQKKEALKLLLSKTKPEITDVVLKNSKISKAAESVIEDYKKSIQKK